jgi:hypothetical protein
MATLILEHEGKRKAAVLNGRVVIGRRCNSHIVVADRTVSRIHAWIGHTAGKYFVVDSGSRVGTLVNGQALKGRHGLADGDQIRVGPALLTFHSNGALPADTEELDLSPRPNSPEDGIFLDCSCGAPLWAPWDFAGRLGQCRYCGQMVELPPKAGAVAPPDPLDDTICPDEPPTAASSPAPPAPKYRGISISPRHQPARVVKPSIFDAPEPPQPPPEPPKPAGPVTLCGACQSEINGEEETHQCPDCGVKFHAECWIENRGCSSYGCQQVGALDPKAPQVAHLELEAPDPAELEFEPLAPPPPPSVPAVEWDYLSLPLALGASLVGLMTFGLPALIGGAALFIYRRRAPAINHPRMLVSSIIICGGGLVLGVPLSWYWWLSGPAV